MLSLSLLLINASLLSSPALSRTRSMHERSISVYKVAHLIQKESETWESFLMRTGRAISSFTQKTNYEAGGWFCIHKENKRFSISIMSNNLHIAHSATKSCPLGPYDLGSVFIHSHPVSPVTLRQEDLTGHSSYDKLNGLSVGRVFYPRYSWAQFSPQDKKLGPSYLIYLAFISPP